MIRPFIPFCCLLVACSHAPPRPDGQAGQCPGVLNTCPTCADSRERDPISGPEAVLLAEEFVRNNGYTNAPALPPEKLILESIERVPSRQELEEARHDSLQPKAYGYGPQGRGWIVMFCFKAVPDDEAG